MTARRTTQTVAQKVALGGHDDDLKDILTATLSRLTEVGLRVMWRIDLDGMSLTEEDVTIGQMLEMERLSGKLWFEVGDPWFVIGARVDWFAFLYMTQGGLDEATARAKADAVKLTDSQQAVSRYTRASLPKD